MRRIKQIIVGIGLLLAVAAAIPAQGVDDDNNELNRGHGGPIELCIVIATHTENGCLTELWSCNNGKMFERKVCAPY